MHNIYDSKEPPDFSLVLGGPVFQLFMRLGLSTPALGLLKKRIIIITLFVWLPLLILSIADGKALKGVRVPFLYDLESQARFLLALPLLIAAELLVHMRLRTIVGQFVDRDIITKNVLPKFKELIASAMALRNSVTMELIVLAVVFIIGHYSWSSISVLEKLGSADGSWYAVTDITGTHLTAAGYWYFFVSRPLFQFILLRWYFRLCIWARFLWQSSRLELNLFSTHPDRAAGLGFLGMSCAALSPLIIAHGVLLAGLIANSIFFAGEKLSDFTIQIIGVVLFLGLIVLGPMLVFSPHLMRAKRIGVREYGMLASRFVQVFDLKWIHKKPEAVDELMGSNDIQSLADFANSFQIIRTIQWFPFGKDTAIQLVVFSLAPVVPLLLTMIPLEELIKDFFKAIF